MIESEDYIMRMVKYIKVIIIKVGVLLVFKLSFDKVNRIFFKLFRGFGMVEGLKIFEKVKVVYDFFIVIDVYEAV